MRPRLFHLASFELAWTDAAFDAFYPEPPSSPLASPPAPAPLGSGTAVRLALPHGVLSMNPARFFDDVLAKIPFEQSLGLRVTLWMIALAPLFTIRKLGTIASISVADRYRVLDRLVTSSNYFVRQLAMSFKAVAALLYAQSDAIRTAMSTPVPSFGVLDASNRSTHEMPREIPEGETGLVSATRLTSRRTSATKGGSNEHAAE